MAFNDHLKYLEDRNPQQRTRLSQQAWLKVTGSTDPVLRDIQERYEEILMANSKLILYHYDIFNAVLLKNGNKTIRQCLSIKLQALEKKITQTFFSYI